MKKNITQEQLYIAIARTQEQFDDYFRGQEDPLMREFVNYLIIPTSSGPVALGETDWFKLLGAGIKAYFYKQLEELGNGSSK